MLIRRRRDIPSSEITDESQYLNRRQFLGVAGGAGAAVAAGGALASLGGVAGAEAATPLASRAQEALTPWEDVTTYNNFYEFGTGKDDPHRNAREFRTEPWTIRIDGLVKRPADYHLEDFLEPHTAEERVYRLRCVEAWSMVIPWLGIPLYQVINRAEPLPSAKYVEFTTLHDPQQMPGQRSPVLQWPYLEGLRLDEAAHPLSLLVTGLYGRELPNQNGAPLRLVVPWKYGFKSIKSIVRMRLTETQPHTAWNDAQPNEYGFYANVNPTVDHPRWSQATERRLGEFRRRETLMFNGYADEVAHLYSGMDLRKFF